MVTVTVVPPPEIDAFEAAPDSVRPGGPATLSWSVRGADVLSIAPQAGDVTGGAAATVTPGETTTYTAGGDQHGRAASSRPTPPR